MTATSVPDTVGSLMPESVIALDESNTYGPAQAGAAAPGSVPA